MSFIFTMPKLSPTMTEGTIAKWHKKVGEYVEAGDVLLEVATDKATVEHAALDPGWLRKIIKEAGASAQVNEPLALFTENKDDPFEDTILAQPKQDTSAQTQREGVSIPISTHVHAAEGGRVVASPLAKKIAHEQKIDLTAIQGSGPRGRIMKRDLEQSSNTAHAPSIKQTPIAISVGPIPFTEEFLSPMRKVIGQRLQLSKTTIPHFYIRQEIDAGALVTTREELKKQNSNCTINDLIIKAVAVALAKHPDVNCGFNEAKQCLIRYQRVDISIAVTIPGGLITPIITQANVRSLTDIAQTAKILATKAKENKLAPDEYQGGSFTISNLGMYGTSEFDAIINPPQGAILGVGAVHDAPLVKHNQVIPGKKMLLTLSCDHRIIDGAEAAEFMKTVKGLLENPLLMLI